VETSYGLWISALSAAAGEVRINGVIEPAELTLVSLLQLRDSTGSLRVFPRGARVDAPLRFHSPDTS
jgi:hypothetical protein